MNSKSTIACLISALMLGGCVSTSNTDIPEDTLLPVSTPLNWSPDPSFADVGKNLEALDRELAADEVVVNSDVSGEEFGVSVDAQDEAAVIAPELAIENPADAKFLLRQLAIEMDKYQIKLGVEKDLAMEDAKRSYVFPGSLDSVLIRYSDKIKSINTQLTHYKRLIAKRKGDQAVDGLKAISAKLSKELALYAALTEYREVEMRSQLQVDYRTAIMEVEQDYDRDIALSRIGYMHDMKLVKISDANHKLHGSALELAASKVANLKGEILALEQLALDLGGEGQ